MKIDNCNLLWDVHNFTMKVFKYFKKMKKTSNGNDPQALVDYTYSTSNQ